MKDPLIFIDTNIFLSFYRTDTKDGLDLLDKVHSIENRLITTTQVEMEFMKNRQVALVGAYEALKVPEKVNLPVIFRNSEQHNALNKAIDAFAEHKRAISKQISGMLAAPSKDDPIFRSVHKLFNNKRQFHLDSGHKDFKEIFEAAEARFKLGYPPRKHDDNSFGDAINWEWIINCANSTTARDIIIVSNDRDFGVQFGDKLYIKDWLLEEFEQRTGGEATLLLVNLFSKALEQVKIPVTNEMRKAEEKIAKMPDLSSLKITEDIQEYLNQISGKFTSLEALQPDPALTNSLAKLSQACRFAPELLPQSIESSALNRLQSIVQDEIKTFNENVRKAMGDYSIASIMKKKPNE